MGICLKDYRQIVRACNIDVTKLPTFGTASDQSAHLLDIDWDNFDFTIPGKEWTYTFDNNTVFLNDIDVIGVAANNAYGYCECVKITELTNDTKVSIKRYFEA